VKKLLALEATLAILSPATSWVQDTSSSNLPDDAARAPDGTRAFGTEPYVGILGRYHSFDRNSEFGSSPTRGRFDGARVSGIAGIYIPVGPVFAGV